MMSALLTTLRTTDWRLMCGNALFFGLCLSIMLDPTGTVTRLKDVFFVLLVAFNVVFMRPSLRFAPFIVLVYAAVAGSFILASMQQNVMDDTELLAICKAFSPLVMLLWIHHYDLVRIAMVPAVVTSLVLGVLYFFCATNPVIDEAVWIWMMAHDDMIMMSHRYILGIQIFGMYYKSLICLMFPLFLAYYRLFNVRTHRFWTWFCVMWMTYAFLVSNTRSSMLLPFFLLGVVSYPRIRQAGQMRYLMYPVLGFLAVVFVVFVGILASERGESSNVIKYAHLTSYAHLFAAHPEYLILGQGPGTMFYTIGFGKMTFKTEWTYIELIRSYGIFALLILTTLLYPLRDMWRHRNDMLTQGMMATYVAYLFVAGTNPLLISSTGMLVVLCAYSYISKLLPKNTTHTAP